MVLGRRITKNEVVPNAGFPTTARGLALFLGLFTLVNLAGDFRLGGTDANLWWIDLSPLPVLPRRTLLAAIAAVLLAYAVAPPRRDARLRRALAYVFLGIAAGAAVANAIHYYVLLARGDIATSLPVPLSLFVAAALLMIVAAHRRESAPGSPAWVLVFLAASVLFPVAQTTLFGLTDYRRPADLIVVFGARAYAGGTPSSALADRVRTGCELYHAGLAPRLLFSGGPGDGAIHETEAMRRLAITLGVPGPAIALDPHGVNTEATVRNTARLLAGRPARVLAVSHFYHLPRIKMTYQRHGLDVFTVPCRTSNRSHVPYNVFRETAAFWTYYLRRLTG
jgi:uncharacterized SAM-binding protein YcdF (DUF218 family)